MIAAPLPGPSETYGAPTTLGFTLHPIVPELMSVSAQTGPYFRPFLESIWDVHSDEEESFDSALRTP